MSGQSLLNKVKAMVGADSGEEKTPGPLWESGPRKLLFLLHWADSANFEVIAVFKPA